MGSSSRVAIGLALRSIAVALLALLAFDLIAREHYYATGAIVAGAAVLTTLSLARAVQTADRIFADFVQSLAAGAADAPTRSAERFPSLASAIAGASRQISDERIARERRVQELEALADTVGSALLLVDETGRVALANRAARELAGGAGGTLDDIPVLGEAAAVLQTLAPGARAIVRLADQRRMLAFAAGFRTGDGARRRLISLQSLSGELSAVELKAWQDLVRVLAHEMMNSLTPILSLTESLQAPGAPPSEADTAAALEVIARRSSGLMSFVERYRRVAELPEPRLEDVQAKRFVAGMDRLMAGLIAERAVAYSSRVEPPDAVIRADPELLEQAIINLLKNALEAVDGAASPRIELRCLRAEGRLVLQVADNGRGLPQADPEQVFTPFFTTKAGGSGIGLSLARQIALAHGGQLTAAPNGEAGVVFTVALPLA
jgi:nitrogen fixation/metabolism regulation signal transduction histidine kinase